VGGGELVVQATPALLALAPWPGRWHGAMHAVAPPLAFASPDRGCVVLAWSDLDSLSWRLVLAVTVDWPWVSATAVKWLQRAQR
jgi:hypothetical protein